MESSLLEVIRERAHYVRKIFEKSAKMADLAAFDADRGIEMRRMVPPAFYAEFRPTNAEFDSDRSWSDDRKSISAARSSRAMHQNPEVAVGRAAILFRSHGYSPNPACHLSMSFVTNGGFFIPLDAVDALPSLATEGMDVCISRCVEAAMKVSDSADIRSP